MNIFKQIITLAVFALVIPLAPIQALELSGVSDATYDIETRAGTGDDCDDSDPRCHPDGDRATEGSDERGVTKEIDKATPALAADTNVCDGVTCADGSCAATADECSALAESLGDPIPGIDITTNNEARAQNQNSSRSNETEGMAPGGPDYNDTDDDGDGLPTRADGGIDKATPKLFEALYRDSDSDGDGIGDVDGDGYGDVFARAGGFIKIGDIKGEVRENPDTRERRLSQIAVAARDLRNWTTEDKEAFAALRTAVASNTPEHASIRIVEQMFADDQIEEVEASETEARVRYRTNMRLFGIIPFEREVEARIEANGEVEIEYPWYSFLATKPDTERIRSVLSSLIGSVSGGGGAGKVSL